MNDKPKKTPREQVINRCEETLKELFGKDFTREEIQDLISEIYVKNLIPKRTYMVDDIVEASYSKIIMILLAREIKSLKEEIKRLKQYHNCPDCAADEIRYEDVKK